MAGRTPPPEAFPSHRTACLLVPEFVAAVHARADRTLRRVPFAVAGRLEKRDRVSALSAAARAGGVKPGMTTVQALAVCAELRLVADRPALERQAVAAVVTALQTVSPAVEAAGGGLFYLDPRGLSGLFGPETRILERMVAAVEPLGLGVPRAAAAGTRFAAFAAAACAEEAVTVVPAGTDRAFLAPLGLELLPLSDENLRRLHALGLADLGGFAALPAPSVEVRYGAEGVLAHRLARGLGGELLTRAPEIEEIEETLELETRAADLVLLTPVLETLIDRILRRLEGRGVLGIEVSFLLDDDEIVEVITEPAAPCADRRTLLTLLSLEIGRTPFSAPVVEATLRVLVAAPRASEQGRLFARRRKDPARVRRTLARLRALFGKNALQRLTLHPAHRPEARTRAAPLQPPRSGPAVCSLQPAACSPAALRLLTPPRPIRVRLEDGRIHSFTHGRRLDVRLRFGPTRLSGEWWEEPFDRDYFTVATTDRGLYWLFLDRASDRWYLHGVFD